MAEFVLFVITGKAIFCIIILFMYFKSLTEVTLMHVFSRQIEKVIFTQLYLFFHEEKMFYDAQYGLRKEHSIGFTALELGEKVIVEMDQMK